MPRSGRSTAASGKRPSRSGMAPWPTMRLVILPQAARVVVPPLGNEFITMLKQTSLLSVIGVTELFRTSSDINSADFKTFEIFFVAAIWYLILTAVWTLLQNRIEARLARSDRAVGGRRAAGRRSTGSHGWGGERAGRSSRRSTSQKWFGPLHVLRTVSLTVHAEGGGGDHRPVRLGKEHVPALPQPPREDRRRHAHRQRASDRLPHAAMAVWWRTPSAASPRSGARSAWSSSGSICSRT